MGMVRKPMTGTLCCLHINLYLSFFGNKLQEFKHCVLIDCYLICSSTVPCKIYKHCLLNGNWIMSLCFVVSY
jgi:hypothetical protein